MVCIFEGRNLYPYTRFIPHEADPFGAVKVETYVPAGICELRLNQWPAQLSVSGKQAGRRFGDRYETIQTDRMVDSFHMDRRQKDEF